MNLGTFFVVLLSFTGAAVTVIGAVVWAIAHVRRLPASSTSGQWSAEELDTIRARLEDLEQREVRIEEIAERLDFVERVLGRAREAKSLPDPSKRQ